MNKALLLDRDGIINIDDGYVYKSEQFRFMDGIFELCSVAQEKGYMLIVVTNQSGIARGYYSEDDFVKLNQWMLSKFNERNIQIEKVYYCPYHPEKGIGQYKKESFERKPNPGMILKAKDEFDIDLLKSIMIGDKDSDMKAGNEAGVGQLILVPGKYAYVDIPEVIVVKSLKDVIDYL